MTKDYKNKDNIKTRQTIITDAINDYFNNTTVPDFILSDAVKDAEKTQQEQAELLKLRDNLINVINNELYSDNRRNKHKKYKDVETLTRGQLVQVINHLATLKTVQRYKKASRANSELMRFNEDTKTYKNALEWIDSVINQLNQDTNIKPEDVINDIKAVNITLYSEFKDADTIAVKNGLYNAQYYAEHGKLIPFTRDKIVINPINTNFNPEATNPEVTLKDGTKFNVNNWLMELANNNPRIYKLLWQVISLTVYYNRRYPKAFLLYSEQGANGKSSFTELLKNLIGEDASYAYQMSDFSDNWTPQEVTTARLLYGDENKVEEYLDDSTNFKKALTGEPIKANQKYKDPLLFTFTGRVVQCLNSLPRTKDKTNSLLRRCLLIPFLNCFKDNDNTDIKDKYLKDPAVLEYVLNEAIRINAHTIEEPPEVEELLNEFKINNDTLLQFWEDCEPRLQVTEWDHMPYNILYSCYVSWYKKYHNNRDININQRKFTRDFKLKILPDLEGWDDKGKFRTSDKMRNYPCNLIIDYWLVDYMNKNATGKEWQAKATPGDQLASTYNGLTRKEL